MPIRILIVDDHSLVRTGFRMLLASADDLVVAGEAGSGEEAYRLHSELKPDVVIMDLAMPGIGGIEAIRRILARDHGAKILALSAHEDISYPKRVLQAGALGYLSKRGAADALIDAVRDIAQGRRVIDPQIAQRLAVEQLEGTNPVERLSEREFEVFLRLAQGMSTNRIAEDLKLSPSTIGTHLYNVKQKLNVTNQSEMTLLAIRRGLIEP